MIHTWLGILEEISTGNDLGTNDVIKRIKEKLEVADPHIYEEWKKTNFDVNNIINFEQCTLVHLAASVGCTKVVKALIENGADVNAVDKHKRTPLHLASWSGHKKVVETLIKNEANVNLVGHEFEKTPLHLAAENGYTEIVKILIESDANVNAMDRKKLTPLYFAAKGGHKEAVYALMKNGADPLLRNKNKTLRYLAKIDNLKQNQEDDRYELLKYSLLCRDSRSLVDILEEDTFDDLTCAWSGEVLDLTPSQNELNNELLSILQACPSFNDEGDYDENGYIARLKKFLEKNQSNQDLKVVLNLRRGESKLTVLHAISSIAWVEKEYDDSVALFVRAGADPNVKDDRGRVPLHYATGLNGIDFLLNAGANPNVHDNEWKTPLHHIANTNYSWCVDLLLENGADPSMCDKQGKTPLDIAIDNRNYFVEEYLLTNEQKILQQELYNVLDENNPPSPNRCLIKLKKFLDKHRNTQNLSRILNLHEDQGESQIFQIIRDAFHSDKTAYKEAEKLLLIAGAKDFKELGSKKTLWNNLILNQQVMLKTFLDEVDAAQDMNQLEEVVNEAIECGVRFNFPHQGKLYRKMHESKYSFMDYVIKRISELKKNPEVASNIVCGLISKGAVLYNINSMNVLNMLESEFKDHKTNMIEAYEYSIQLTLDFMEIVKSASTGEVKDAKIDNSTLYLEYSKDHTRQVKEIKV
ncbi:ankyrin repeat domain-containing protein [Wolbachia endosymbiont (group B) of Longitarsus flavicornis]|uniref:ankyrin repeat domain-containing protein n=1 Tax=Wolbachia endosymbiont (group B) of Longitarsus flavicornis TaxID=3066135 RepID=UPI003342C041